GCMQLAAGRCRQRRGAAGPAGPVHDHEDSLDHGASFPGIRSQEQSQAGLIIAFQMSTTASLRFTISPAASQVDQAERERRLANPGFGQIFTEHMVSIHWNE